MTHIDDSDSENQGEIKRKARALDDAAYQAWDNEDLSPYQRANLNRIPCYKLGFMAGVKHAQK